MKRHWFIVSLVLAALLAMAGIVTAASPGAPLPSGAEEVTVWELNGSTWESLGKGAATVGARSWNSGGPHSSNGYTNQQNTGFTFTSHASVAQWIQWSLTGGNRKDWRIRRPGTYASDSMSFSIKSNNDVDVEFSGFDDMIYENPDLVPDGTKDYIPTWYGLSLGGGEPDDVGGWIRAGELAEVGFTIPNSNAFHDGYSAKLFSMIEVCDCNNSSDYHNEGQVTFVLTNMKHWINPETGSFAADQLGSAPPIDGGV